jgi:hypothetical protein
MFASIEHDIYISIMQNLVEAKKNGWFQLQFPNYKLSKAQSEW